MVMVFALLPTLLYIPILGELGQPRWNFDAGAIRGSYCGLLLLGAAYTSIGVLVSTWTRNPLVAFLLTLLLLVFGFIGFTALGQFSWLGSWDLAFTQIGMEAHYRAMSMGVLHARDLVYFFAGHRSQSMDGPLGFDVDAWSETPGCDSMGVGIGLGGCCFFCD